MKKKLLISAAIIFLIGVSAVLIWASVPRPTEIIALEALESGPQAAVEIDQWIVFKPVDSQPSVGFIFYPGGKVEAQAYAPTLKAIAAGGYLVVAVPMPLNNAIYGIDKALEVIAAYPDIQTWVLGGHSLGGSMAVRFVYENQGQMDGLVLWAAYPARNNDISTLDLPVISIYGSEDGGVGRIERNASRLPADTILVRIEGGNHGQFGYYGPQNGDGAALISREDQQAQIIQATLDFLSQFVP
jgi:pimeloyl-ACP methyl ester carboxylesterase